MGDLTAAGTPVMAVGLQLEAAVQPLVLQVTGAAVRQVHLAQHQALRVAHQPQRQAEASPCPAQEEEAAAAEAVEEAAAKPVPAMEAAGGLPALSAVPHPIQALIPIIVILEILATRSETAKRNWKKN